MKLSETCTCGASFAAEDAEPDQCRQDLAAWREQHRCPRLDPWRRSQASTSDIRLDFGFSPDHPRPMEAT